jgi:hypothetical protein
MSTKAVGSQSRAIDPIVLFFMEFDGSPFSLKSGKTIDITACLNHETDDSS